MNSQLVRLCERIALVGLVLAVIISLGLGLSQRWTLSMSAGFVITLVNLVGLRWILSRLVHRVQQQHLNPEGAQQGAGGVGGLMALLIVKVTGSLGVVWLLLKFWQLDTYGFGLGVSLVVGTLVIVPLLAPSEVASGGQRPAQEP
jgi:hypothetical protein